MDGDGGAERGVTALAVLNEEGGAVACGAVEWTERGREWRWKGLRRLPSNDERTRGYSRCEWRALKSIVAGSQEETCLFQLSNSDGRCRRTIKIQRLIDFWTTWTASLCAVGTNFHL